LLNFGGVRAIHDVDAEFPDLGLDPGQPQEAVGVGPVVRVGYEAHPGDFAQLARVAFHGLVHALHDLPDQGAFILGFEGVPPRA